MPCHVFCGFAVFAPRRPCNPAGAVFRWRAGIARGGGSEGQGFEFVEAVGQFATEFVFVVQGGGDVFVASFAMCEGVADLSQFFVFVVEGVAVPAAAFGVAPVGFAALDVAQHGVFACFVVVVVLEVVVIQDAFKDGFVAVEGGAQVVAVVQRLCGEVEAVFPVALFGVEFEAFVQGWLDEAERGVGGSFFRAARNCWIFSRYWRRLWVCSAKEAWASRRVVASLMPMVLRMGTRAALLPL